MAARNADVPEQRRMLFRIGINLGDVVHDETGIYGDGINVAARLEALAAAGGVLVSHAVHEQVRDVTAHISRLLARRRGPPDCERYPMRAHGPCQAAIGPPG
jgi:adenylate cyclase